MLNAFVARSSSTGTVSAAVGGTTVSACCTGAVSPVPGPSGTEVVWVVRGDRPHGEALAEAVRAARLPEGRLSIFVHGNAYMVRDLRRYLCREAEVPRTVASMSGYWRPGATEDLWQATKREFSAEADAAVPLAKTA